MLSIGHDLSGSYLPVVGWLLVLPLAIVVVGLVAPMPRAEDATADASE